jgi:signal recognition particle GTPase
MQLLLTSKNVAPSTAQAICEVVEKQLLGKKVGTLVGVKRAVRHALEDAVERILSPELGGISGRVGVTRGKTVDVLRGVVEKRERRKSGGLLGLGGGAVGKGQPYVIVMIGINGTLLYSYCDEIVFHSDLLISPHLLQVWENPRPSPKLPTTSKATNALPY